MSSSKLNSQINNNLAVGGTHRIMNTSPINLQQRRELERRSTANMDQFNFLRQQT